MVALLVMQVVVLMVEGLGSVVIGAIGEAGEIRWPG